MLQQLRISSPVMTLSAGLKTLLSTAGSMDSVRVEKRAEDESILSVAEGLFTTPAAGTGTATKTPQDALVFSLRTTTPGPKGRGRMYWPALGAGLTASFQLSSPPPGTIPVDMSAWLGKVGDELNDYFIASADPRRVVLSVRSVKDHVCRDVNSVQVGTVLDTQRRRRDALPETYYATEYPYIP
jgi:hypothetical protein